MSRALCPTTGLRSYPTAEAALSDDAWIRGWTCADHETYPCPDADHWHVWLTPTPRSRWWWPW